MEELEMLEQTNETENVETETTEEIQDEGIELTDTTEAEAEETQEVKKTLKQLLSEDEEYQEQFNTMMKTRLERAERNYQKKMAGYKDVDNVLRKTLNISEDADVSQELRNYYSNEGIELPERYTPGLSSREIEALAQIDVSEIEEDGHEAMVTEANRLATIGYKNLNDREKIVFNSLAEKLTKAKEEQELLKIGAKKELLNDESFREFRKNFSNNASIEFVYGLYTNQKPKKQFETAGSMKNISTDNKKTIFSDEDILKMTDEELEANWDAIRKFQTQQK
jgi:hypothetical protein